MPRSKINQPTVFERAGCRGSAAGKCRSAVMKRSARIEPPDKCANVGGKRMRAEETAHVRLNEEEAQRRAGTVRLEGASCRFGRRWAGGAEWDHVAASRRRSHTARPDERAESTPWRSPWYIRTDVIYGPRMFYLFRRFFQCGGYRRRRRVVPPYSVASRAMVVVTSIVVLLTDDVQYISACEQARNPSVARGGVHQPRWRGESESVAMLRSRGRLRLPRLPRRQAGGCLLK